MGDERVNSMCSVYADLIETQLRSDDPDMDLVFELLGYIRTHCQTVGFAPGEVPDHLEAHLFEEGDAPTPTEGGPRRAGPS